MSSEALRPLIGTALVGVVRTSERLGLLAALEQPTTAAELARRLALPERALSLTLDVLVAVGYVERLGAIYRRPADWDGAQERLPELEAFVRTGEVPDYIDRPENRAAYYANSVLELGAMFEHAARELAEQLRPVERIADVGAGSGIWSLAMVERHAGRVLAIDRAEVLPSTHKLAEMMGLDARLTSVAGDYFEVTLDQSVDRVVLANVLHLENEEDAARLIRHHAQALDDDGELVIVDVIGGDEFEQQLFEAVYQLHLGMRTAKGRAHDLNKLRSWCEDAGLVAQEVLHLGPHGMGAVVCSRSEVTVHSREMTTLPAEELRALREESDVHRARFRMVFEGAADAIMAVDKRGESIIRTNSGFSELFEVDWSGHAVHSLDSLVAPADRDRCRRLLVGLASGAITERRHHITMLRNGVPFAVELTAYDPLSRSVIVLIVRDRDRMVRQEKLQALGELVGGFSHDLNTPLGTLKANCALAQTLARRMSGSSPAEPRHLEALDAATTDALRALDDIASKLEAIESFATLEGHALQELAPHFKSGLAHAICERAARLDGE
jgi:cyclopropane fatty-acyl-phospholipid synthase-like methyltransferase